MLDQHALKTVQQDISTANGLPNAAYTDAQIFRFERDHLFTHTWAAISFSTDLPGIDQNNGKAYAKPIDFMGLPLLLLRDNAGELRVFHNICSHRGRILVDQEGPIGPVICCPYHCWTYQLDGSLKATPHIGGVGVHTADGFTSENKGLKQIAHAEWMGIVFVNLSGEAEPFADFIAPLEKRWEALAGKGSMAAAHTTSENELRLAVKANWKLAVENYCEAYHLPWVHPDLNSYSPLAQHYNLLADQNLSGQGTHSYTLAETAGVTLPTYPNWDADKLKTAEYLALYPNVLLGIQLDHFFVMLLTPISPDLTEERVQIAYAAAEALDDEFQDSRKAVIESWRQVFAEDVSMVEGMQAGRQSPGFTGGTFSPALDESSHHFHHWVATQYSTVDK